MNRTTSVTILALAFTLVGSLALSSAPAIAQDPAVQTALDDYARGLSTCDPQSLSSCTGAAFMARLRNRLSTCSSGQLGTFRRAAPEVQLEPGLVQGTLLWTQPDGVEQVMVVVVKRAGDRWMVVGGPVP